jgi:CBS domain containing-hemolysin-like protein
MIAAVIALISTLILVLLARPEGSLPAEEEPPDPGETGDVALRASRYMVQFQLLRFAAAIAAVVAGVAAASALRSASLPVAWAVVVAFLICLVVFYAGARLHLTASRSAPPHYTAASQRAGERFGIAARAMRRVSGQLSALTARRGPVESRDEASEQFSRVLSSEADMSEDEERMLRRAISLPRTLVHEVMVPRTGIVGVESGSPWPDVLDRIRSSEHSRLPVFRESLDDVTGVIVAKDLLPFALDASAPPSGWESLARRVEFIPATKPAADQLRDFRSSRTHMAVVVDEYGGTAGILTIEDLLEELVGEIRDEHDVEEPPFLAEDESRFWLSGRLSLDDLEENLGEKLEWGSATTVGGIVYERIGRVPKVGEVIQWDGFRLVVERMKRHAVDRVLLERSSHGEDDA